MSTRNPAVARARVRVLPTSRLMSAAEAAEYLEIDRETLYREVRMGRIKAGKPLGRLLFDPREIRRYDGQDVPDWAQ